MPWAAITRAHKPENSGAARLVPPICCCRPSTMTIAPVLGSASNAISATPRVVCPAFSPTPCRQLGISSKLLGLPPVSLQTVSPDQLEPDVLSVVPPTATTYCEAAGQLGSLLPSPHSSEPESPEDT